MHIVCGAGGRPAQPAADEAGALCDRLVDRPDILEILWAEGIRFTRTWGRDERDWQPVPLEVQPFWSRVQGFPELLEVPLHGWQDLSLRKSVGWANHEAFLAGVFPYLERAAARGLTFSYCTHDHSSTREDPEMAITRALLRRARDLGLETPSYAAYYRRALERRPGCGREAAG